MKKSVKYFVLGIAAIFLLVTLYKNMAPQTKKDIQKTEDTLQVTTTFFPLAEFAKAIGGEKVSVVNLTPAGAEPHDFEPTAQDVVQIQNSAFFIYNGAGFEAWVERILPDLDNSKTLVVDSSHKIKLVEAVGQDHQHEGGQVHNHDHDELYDPHVWLSPIMAIQQVESISEGLVKLDPENKDFYELRASAYIEQLQLLNEAFQTGLSSCQKNTIITSHDAFGYLENQYGFEVYSVSGLSPDEEPSPMKLAEISDYAKANNIQYIFFETLVDPKLSETIANEVGAQTLVLNPLEGLSAEEEKRGETYLTIQSQNLSNLMTALECQ